MFDITPSGVLLDLNRVSPRWARYFLLLAQEKVPIEKCTRSPHRLCRSPAFLAQPGRAQLARSLALTALRQGARLYPGRAAVLGEGYGPGW
jgi:hypothetical protein